jgi:hypothetical protein
MDLGNFIMEKSVELKEKYNHIELKSIESVVLSKNSVSSDFLTKETPLLQEGKEIDLSEMSEVSSTPFVPNGTIVRFYVKLPKKRKPISKDFYFLWN